MTQAPRTTCDICGRKIKKATTVIDNQAYCAACHKRLCKPSSCTKCGRPLRLPDSAQDRRCRACRADVRQCIRCGREIRKSAFETKLGPTCSYCSRYFRDMERCSVCGKPSRHLSRDIKRGVSEPACPSCRTTHHKLCAQCHRPRELTHTNATGQEICQACHTRGEEFICPTCGKSGSYHSRTMCSDCYWRQKVKHEAQLFLTYVPAVLEDYFLGCIEHYAKDRPQYIHRRISLIYFFFKNMAPYIGKMLIAEELLEKISADYLRKNRLAYSYLAGQNLLPAVEEKDVSNTAAKRQQQELLNSHQSHWYHPVLLRYHDYLQELATRYRARGWRGKNYRYTQRTITGNMRAAACFLLEAEIREKDPDNQLRKLTDDDFYIFAQAHTGYRASILSFVRFLNAKSRRFNRLKVSLKQMRRPVTILSPERCRGQIQAWCNQEGHCRNGIIGLLLLIFAQKVKDVVRLKRSDVAYLADHDIYHIYLNSTQVAMPRQMNGIIKNWLKERDCGRQSKSTYLFPAPQDSNKHLSPSTVTTMLKRRNLDAPLLFRTAIKRFFSEGGIDNPMIVCKITGVNIATALKYFQENPMAGNYGDSLSQKKNE